MNTLRESMTLVVDRNNNNRVRVWREEAYEAGRDRIEASHTEVERAVKDALQGVYETAEAAQKILALDRVNAVEIVSEYGYGEVWYKDWP